MNLVTWKLELYWIIETGMLIEMLSAMLSGNCKEAVNLFDSVSCKNTVCSKAMLLGHVGNGRFKKIGYFSRQ